VVWGIGRPPVVWGCGDGLGQQYRRP